MLARMWRTGNPYPLLLRMKNGTAILEDSRGVSYKTKHILYHRSSYHTPYYLPKKVEKLFLHKNLHTDVYRFIHNLPKKSKQLRGPSVGEWIDKLWYNHKMEYYSVLKKK